VHVEGIELKILHYEISFPATTLLVGLWIYLALQFIIRMWRCARGGYRTQDPALRNFFSHHYTTSLKWVSRFRFEHNMGARYACFCLFWVWQKKVVYYTNISPLHYTDLSPMCVCVCLFDMSALSLSVHMSCIFIRLCFLRWTKHILMLQKVL